MSDANVTIQPENDKPTTGCKRSWLWFLGIAVIVIGVGVALLVYARSVSSTNEESAPAKTTASVVVAPVPEDSAPAKATAPVVVASTTENSTSAKATTPASVASATQVAMRNVQYVPATIEVKPGDVIEWTNDDLVPHTVTSQSFESGVILSGQVWRHTFKNAGNYPYACTFHPEMKGVVIVK